MSALVCGKFPAMAPDMLSEALKAPAAKMPALLPILCNTGGGGWM
jgi:hypothetical protein